jgi:hypothetical protein
MPARQSEAAFNLYIWKPFTNFQTCPITIYVSISPISSKTVDVRLQPEIEHNEHADKQLGAPISMIAISSTVYVRERIHMVAAPVPFCLSTWVRRPPYIPGEGTTMIFTGIMLV